MLQDLIWFDSFQGVPLKHLHDKIFKFEIFRYRMISIKTSPASRTSIVNSKDFMKFTKFWKSINLTVVWHLEPVWSIGQFIEILPCIWTSIQKVLRRHTQNLDNFVHLFDLIVTIEKDLTRMYFNKNAPQWPNVYRIVIIIPEKDLWASIMNRLNCLVIFLTVSAWNAKINDLDFFWFWIA